ncbi:junctional adhesion molecule-like [Brachyhypopomus gauderio]|uniref:junctional adhesion molecule-like n=1 Tax=Brachyhypopomus gauderio TaxID=698409 RepID=UPI0040414B79
MLLSVCVFFIVLHHTEGCTVVKSTSQLQIRSHVGESVLLPCSCTNTHTTPERFTWFKIQDSSYTEISSESEQYRNRVQLGTAHSPGNLSLLISHLTEEDGGLYRCYIEGDEYTDMKLTVEVPQMIIQRHVGGSVLLSCYKTGLHTNTLIWTFRDKEIYPTDQTQRFRGRVQLITDSAGNPSLHISHLTMNDEGIYKCVIGSKRYSVTLQITGSAPVTNVQTRPEPSTTASYQRPTGPHSTETPDSHYPTSMYVIIPIVVLLLLGVSIAIGMYWRYRVRQCGQSGTRDPSTQDDVIYSIIGLSDTTRTATVENSSEKAEYATIKLN